MISKLQRVRGGSFKASSSFVEHSWEAIGSQWRDMISNAISWNGCRWRENIDDNNDDVLTF